MSAHSSNPLFGLLFHSEESIKHLAFEMRPPEATGDPLQLSFTSGSKGDLRAVVILSLSFQIQVIGY